MFLFLSIIFFYIAFGAINRYKTEFKYYEFTPKMGATICVIISFTTYIFPLISYIKFFNLAWYWAILVNFVLSYFISDLLYSFYINLFGIKSKPQISLMKGGYVRKNLFIIDALISFGIGVLSLIIGLL